MKNFKKYRKHSFLSCVQVLGLSGLATLLCNVGMVYAQTQTLPVPVEQKQVSTSDKGIPVDELVSGAPSEYVVKPGDTLWKVSAKFLKNPWRWPDLWAMNKEQIKVPQLIYPGQVLLLDVSGSHARLQVGKRISSSSTSPSENERLMPKVRAESLSDTPIPSIAPNAIEPFLSEPLIVDEETLKNAAWVVAAQDGRRLLGVGDRIYARSQDGQGLQYQDTDEANSYRIFKNATPIKDPATQEILGYEGRFVGRARLVRSEISGSADAAEKSQAPELASLDVVFLKEEVGAGDRLLPEPPRDANSHIPHAPLVEVNGLVSSVYGDAVAHVGQNQIISINKGKRDGITHGDVLALISTGKEMVDRTDGNRTTVKLPDERNGLLYIFRPFERVSYGLVIEIKKPVQVGDKVKNPASINSHSASAAQPSAAD